MSEKKSVAVIGFGVSGVASARWAREVGLDVVVFEKREKTGGIWAPDEKNVSPIWKQLYLNTPGYTAHLAFSPHARQSQFLHNSKHREYLESYAQHYELLPLVRFGASVESAIRQHDEKWKLQWRDSAEVEHTDLFDHVVVATGRYSGKPNKLEALEQSSFSGLVLNSHDVWDVDSLRGKKVVVCGYGNTATELALELSHRFTDESCVLMATRAPHDVVGKYLKGKPSELLLFSRFPNHLARAVPPEAMIQGSVDMLHANFGRGDKDFGGIARPDDLKLDFSICEGFTHALNEQKIQERAPVASAEGRTVHFTDGTSEPDVDVVLVCHGMQFGADHLLPFLSERARRDLHAGDHTQHMFDLDRFTWSSSPELRGLAFVGMSPAIGGITMSYELNARWVAYVFAGLVAEPSGEELQAGIQFCRMFRQANKFVPSPMLAGMYGAAAGVTPPLTAHKDLAWGLLFGPIQVEDYFLQGPHSRPEEALAALRSTYSFTFGGRVPTVPSASQMGALQMVAAKTQNPELQQLVELFQELAQDPDAIVATD